VYKLIRPLLFALDPEAVHHGVTGGLRRFNKIPGARSLLRSLYAVEDPRLEREVFGK